MTNTKPRRFFKISLALVAILLVTGFTLRTPDTDFDAMHDKYGGALAKYSQGTRIATDNTVMNIHYRDQGNPNGEPIVFIHGSSASLHTWEDLIANMSKGAENRYRFISLDLPGHGLTGPHPKDDYSADGMMQGVDMLLDTLNIDSVSLVGNSMGGWISWRYALANPERVKALILVDAAGAPTTEHPPLNLGFRLMRNPITRPLTKIFTPRSIIKTSIEQTVYDPSRVDDKTTDLYWELLRYPGNRRATSIRALIDREDAYGKRLSEIQIPTLILWGEEDQLIYVASAHTFHEALPNSQLITYPNIGHIPMEETPEEMAKDVLIFLGEALKKEAP